MIMFHQYEETLDLTVAIREFLTLNRAWICCVLFARFAPQYARRSTRLEECGSEGVHVSTASRRWRAADFNDLYVGSG